MEHELHVQSIYHRRELDQALEVSCFYCLRVYPRKMITKYTDDEQTAICHYCGIDSIIPGRIPDTNLHEMKLFWFNDPLLAFLKEKREGSYAEYEPRPEEQKRLRGLASQYGANTWLSLDRDQVAEEQTIYFCKDCEQHYPNMVSGPCAFCEKNLTKEDLEEKILLQPNMVNFTFSNYYPKS